MQDFFNFLFPIIYAFFTDVIVPMVKLVSMIWFSKLYKNNATWIILAVTE